MNTLKISLVVVLTILTGFIYSYMDPSERIETIQTGEIIKFESRGPVIVESGKVEVFTESDTDFRLQTIDGKVEPPSQCALGRPGINAKFYCQRVTLSAPNTLFVSRGGNAEITVRSIQESKITHQAPEFNALNVMLIIVIIISWMLLVFWILFDAIEGTQAQKIVCIVTMFLACITGVWFFNRFFIPVSNEFEANTYKIVQLRNSPEKIFVSVRHDIAIGSCDKFEVSLSDGSILLGELQPPLVGLCKENYYSLQAKQLPPGIIKVLSGNPSMDILGLDRGWLVSQQLPPQPPYAFWIASFLAAAVVFAIGIGMLYGKKPEGET